MGVLLVVSSAAFAETGVIEVDYIHENFTYVKIRGEAAKLIYEKMDVAETESRSLTNHYFGQSKRSVDGRMACLKEVSGSFSCLLTYGSTTGEIYSTFSKTN